MALDPNKDPKQPNQNTNPNGNQGHSGGINLSTDKFNNLMNGFKTMKNTVHNLTVKVNDKQQNNVPNANHAAKQKQISNTGNVGNALNNNGAKSNNSKVDALTKQVNKLQAERRNAVNHQKLTDYALQSLKKNGLSTDKSIVSHVIGKNTDSIDNNVKFLKTYGNSNIKKQRKVPKSTQRKQNNVNIGDALFKQTRGSRRSLDQYIQGNKGGQY